MTDEVRVSVILITAVEIRISMIMIMADGVKLAVIVAPYPRGTARWFLVANWSHLAAFTAPAVKIHFSCRLSAGVQWVSNMYFSSELQYYYYAISTTSLSCKIQLLALSRVLK